MYTKFISRLINNNKTYLIKNEIPFNEYININEIPFNEYINNNENILSPTFEYNEDNTLPLFIKALLVVILSIIFFG